MFSRPTQPVITAIRPSNNQSSLAGTITLLLAALFSASSIQAAPADEVSRGAYLVHAGGCGDCHTPMKMGAQGPEPDMQRLFSGHPANLKMTPATIPAGGWSSMGSFTNTAFQGPWGISYAINLTPDMETGLGKWTEANFVGALKTGKHLGVSRPILPPMPWRATRHLTDSDLKAMFVYLRSLPPIVNRVPDPTPPGPVVAGR